MTTLTHRPSAPCGRSARTEPRRKSAPVLVLCLVWVLALALSACDPLEMKQMSTFANLKYEPPARVAVMVKRRMTNILWAKRTSEVRHLLAKYGPAWNWRLALCTYVHGTALFCGYVQHVEQRFLSDARTRGDLREALDQAHHDKGCFTWSFTVPNRSNYTTRSAHDSHCNW